MPWEKSFDIHQAVDKATEVFWAKGYKATSLADLLNATGINKGSFYNAFGSKKALFIQSLLKYDDQHCKAMVAELAALNDPITAITKLFDDLIEESLTDQEHKGCFLINTALNLPYHDEDTQKIIKNSLAHIEAFFKQQIELGQANGAISVTLDSMSAAKGLLSLIVGLRVLARGVFNQDELLATKKQAMHLIQL